MSRLFPLFRHTGRRNTNLTRSAPHQFLVIYSHLNQELLTKCHSLIFSQKEEQRRLFATNRRQRPKKSKAGRNRLKTKDPKRDRRRGKLSSIEGCSEKLLEPRDKLCIPPTLLVSTASPYVYISQTGLGGEEEEDSIDPNSLFSEVVYGDNGVLSLPPLFAKGEFEYFSPKTDLDYEYPTDGLPEIAFLGRSNVGKSSLINAIMRKNLCLTSRTPGRTQLPYYYGIVPKVATDQKRQQQRLRGKDPSTAKGFIIDLPGYGYGRAPTNITENWQKDTQDLLLHRRHEAGVLQRLFLLMDARRGKEGPNEHDRIVMRWLEDAEIPFSIVLTKADRVSVPVVIKQVNDFCLRFASQQQQRSVVTQSPVIHVTSSTRGWGIHELMVSIETEFLAEIDEERDSILG